jgi:hypothetical protein
LVRPGRRNIKKLVTLKFRALLQEKLIEIVSERSGLSYSVDLWVTRDVRVAVDLLKKERGIIIISGRSFSCILEGKSSFEISRLR